MSETQKQQGRLIIVSNRLPVVLKKKKGAWEVTPGSGGLVTAMAPVLRDRGGVWIGWPGATVEDAAELDRLLGGTTRTTGFTLAPVNLTDEETHNYYHGFSNEIIWPLFHDLQAHCNFVPEYWRTYEEVNRKFARVIKENAREGDYIWVHDYHLMNAAKELRAHGVGSSLGFFLHIPFPPLDMFLKLPWRFQVLRGLLEYDLIGFQTARDRRNFVQCVRTLLKDVPVRGKGRVNTMLVDGREVRVGTFPISIDFADFTAYSAKKEVSDRAWYLHEDLSETKIILGVDRLDYTKGIPLKLKAFRDALKRFPELRGKVALVQVVVPSRADIPRYHELKAEIEGLVGEINGQFTDSGWVPIHYLFRSLDKTELLAYYRTAEIALVTPLKDGMNLVAKEYCACSLEEDCVLILSEFAGAAAQLQSGALLVNPYNIEGTAETIYEAYTMGEAERRARMKKLRRSIRRQDIFWWVDSFLKAGIAHDLDDFPPLEDYVPHDEEEHSGMAASPDNPRAKERLLRRA